MDFCLISILRILPSLFGDGKNVSSIFLIFNYRRNYVQIYMFSKIMVLSLDSKKESSCWAGGFFEHPDLDSSLVGPWVSLLVGSFDLAGLEARRSIDW